MFIDNAKNQLLDVMGALEEVDLSRTPTYFFLSRLREELVAHGLEEWVEPVLGGITVEIGALGLESEPHKEWLSLMAKSYATLINKVITTFKVFGDEVVRSQFSKLSLKLE